MKTHIPPPPDVDVIKRDRAAFTLFAAIYDPVLEADPTFPARVWTEMTSRQKWPWRRRADAVLAS